MANYGIYCPGLPMSIGAERLIEVAGVILEENKNNHSKWHNVPNVPSNIRPEDMLCFVNEFLCMVYRYGSIFINGKLVFRNYKTFLAMQPIKFRRNNGVMQVYLGFNKMSGDLNLLANGVDKLRIKVLCAYRLQKVDNPPKYGIAVYSNNGVCIYTNNSKIINNIKFISAKDTNLFKYQVNVTNSDYPPELFDVKLGANDYVLWGSIGVQHIKLANSMWDISKYFIQPWEGRIFISNSHLASGVGRKPSDNYTVTWSKSAKLYSHIMVIQYP
ncbi:Uncharacterised protein [[Actinobacillus] rossii]|uniref:Uncharacterized protein n=1 Tax=[Actinobacillus] rossii TaxID=123820 RepID=A0A380TY50_9PAST|nr:Uncharacterised protein [[Actinobacillus] rossii]